MYLFYVDESGNLDTGNNCHWLYTLTAIGLFEHNWRKFYIPIVDKKRQFIERINQRTGIELYIHQCEIKSTWLRIPKRRTAESPFLVALTAEEMTELSELYYCQMDKSNVVCISVAIDKRELHSYFDRSKLHRKAWEMLCERIEYYMREFHPKHRAIIIADDVSPQENASLAAKHAFFIEQQTSAKMPIRRIIEMPLFVRSELSEGVQLADLCAYNLYHSISYNKPEYPFFTRILPHYYNSGNTSPDKLDGLKVFPDASATLSNWLGAIKRPLPR
jgi:hypothetical protein